MLQGAKLSMSTIAAIATPPGAGGIGIVRLSGPRAKALLARMFLPLSPRFENFRPWFLHRGRVLDRYGEALDDVLAVFMPGPRTFTGEDMAEIHCHGGPLIVQAVLESILRLGARQAERGEFSRRAFVNGRMDLSQAEAVAELIAAPSREALRYSLNRLDGLLGRRVLALREELEALRVQVCLAVDFPEEEVECLAPAAFGRAVTEVACSVRRLLAGQKEDAEETEAAPAPEATAESETKPATEAQVETPETEAPEQAAPKSPAAGRARTSRIIATSVMPPEEGASRPALDLGLDELPPPGGARPGAGANGRGANRSGSPDQAGILSPLSEAEATSGLFTGRPRLNEFLSVMKLTWKLARRDKK